MISDACRWYALQLRTLDDECERAEIVCDVVGQGRIRDFFGFNRAKHAVLEAAILATRTEFLAADEILAEMRRLERIVVKTAGGQRTTSFSVSAETHSHRVGERGRLIVAYPTVHVTAPSRLHFGMLSFGRTDVAQYGGVGMMVDVPAVKLHISPSLGSDWEFCGPGADRAESFASRWVRTTRRDNSQGCRIEIQQLPPSSHGPGDRHATGAFRCRWPQPILWPSRTVSL